MDLDDLVHPGCELFALGEPTHREPLIPQIRNEWFARLAARGFRSIALETDRVAALAVDRYVRTGEGSPRTGLSHGLGDLDANRQLIAWMRAHNAARPPQEHLAFHGFDAPTEMMSAPSPRRFLEHARSYTGVDIEFDLGADERWSRTEAVLDPAESVGGTPSAVRAGELADDLLTALHSRAPELVAATSRAAWFDARTHLLAGIWLLRYHALAARPLEPTERTTRMLALRDVRMAENLLDIRTVEGRRGPTLLFAHNRHLQRTRSEWTLAGTHLSWNGAGAVLGALLGERYVVVAGSLGHNAAVGLGEPAPGTHESCLPPGLTPAADVRGTTRTDVTPEMGHFPLDRTTLDGVDAVLHVA